MIAQMSVQIILALINSNYIYLIYIILNRRRRRAHLPPRAISLLTIYNLYNKQQIGAKRSIATFYLVL